MFGNQTQTQLNPIKLYPWIEFDIWVQQPNQIEHQTLCQLDFWTNQTQLNKSNQNQTWFIQLCLAAKIDQMQSNGLCSIVFGE